MTFLSTLADRINQATAGIAAGCGGSDVLFEQRMHNALAGVLAQAPEGEREAVEAELIEEYEFEPNFEPFEAAPGECSLTGITVNCCPCGHHE
jgi:hypothetical protein